MPAEHQGPPGDHEQPVTDEHGRSESLQTSRRGFLLAGLGTCLAATLPGCSSTTSTSSLPGPAWDLRPEPWTPGTSSAAVAANTPAPLAAAAGPPSVAPLGVVLPRTQWATGRPVPTLMDSMTRIRYITVHHDGMRPFFGDDSRSAAGRLDAIRRSHRSKNWGDIGYHFAIDRAGNIWEGRPIVYQGAHVKDHNEGNIGIVALGNFERQWPTEAQLRATLRQIDMLKRLYNVPMSRIRTHREWAATACPGRNLQRAVASARASGRMA